LIKEIPVDANGHGHYKVTGGNGNLRKAGKKGKMENKSFTFLGILLSNLSAGYEQIRMKINKRTKTVKGFNKNPPTVLHSSRCKKSSTLMNMIGE